jgi:indolepyruvate ferredoxin oxidoreductase beta subunit
MEKVNAELGKIKNLVSFNASEIAKAIKARSNMVLLGATVPYLGIDLKKVEEAILHIFGSKGAEVVEVNMQALHAGYEQAKK